MSEAVRRCSPTSKLYLKEVVPEGAVTMRYHGVLIERLIGLCFGLTSTGMACTHLPLKAPLCTDLETADHPSKNGSSPQLMNV